MENVKKYGAMLLVVLAGLAIHQAFIAPRIGGAKKA